MVWNLEIRHQNLCKTSAELALAVKQLADLHVVSSNQAVAAADTMQLMSKEISILAEVAEQLIKGSQGETK